MGFGIVPLIQWIVVPAMMMGGMKHLEIVGLKNTEEEKNDE